jgi:hypothetical protein
VPLKLPTLVILAGLQPEEESALQFFCNPEL